MDRTRAEGQGSEAEANKGLDNQIIGVIERFHHFSDAI